MSIQFTTPVHAQPAADSSGNNGSSSTKAPAVDYQQVFMQLLATELRSQDPTQPINPTEMVTQMVQINQLSDVAGIYSLLQKQAAATTSSTAQSSNHAANATTPAIQR